MPVIKVDDTLEMAYRVDDFTDPWKDPETILLVHGGLKPQDLYYGWIPTLSRHLRVIRPYIRGHWGSTPAPEGYQWTIENLVSDLKHFLDAMGLDKVHYVGESLGGTLGYNFAYRYPERLKTLTITNSPGPTLKGHRMALLADILRKEGVAATVDFVDTSRSDERTGILGLDKWFNTEAKKNPLEAAIGYVGAAAKLEVNADNLLSQIKVPTLLLTGSEFSSLITIKEAEHFRDLIPRSKLVVIPGVRFIAVVSAPERCAGEVLQFIGEQAAG